VLVVQVHSPVVALAVHDEPVSVHVPLDGLVPCAAVESWTTAPAGADPENVRVVSDVRLSEGDDPLSEALARFGSVTAGSAYRTTTIPDPPPVYPVLAPPPSVPP